MWSVNNPAQRRYMQRMLVAAALCIVFSLAAVGGIRHGHVSGLPSYFLAIMPAIPVAWTLVITGAYLGEEKDEFQRNVYVQAILCGVAITLAIVTAWGYMEDFGRAPHLRLAWIYPMFWIFVAAAQPLIRARYR